MALKRFKEFINESVRDILQPKSEEEILSSLGDTSSVERFRGVYRYGLSKKYLPENEDEVRLMIINKIKEINKENCDLANWDAHDVAYMGIIYREVDDKSHEIISEVSDKGIGIWRLEGEDNEMTHSEIIHWEYLSNEILVKVLEEIYTGDASWEEIEEAG